jgi:hypothetical protein
MPSNLKSIHPRYDEWIRYVFDHPVNDRQWYFDLDAPAFEATQEDYADLIRETFSRTGQDLVQFSDAQVDQGIWFLASASGSDFSFSLIEETVPTQKKINAIRSIYSLYRDCFARRCTEVLGHTDEPGASDLNSICYMFWDVCPISNLDKAHDRQELEDAIFWVLENTIKLPHRACIEGGLHGLGEIAYQHEKRVNEVITNFLKTAPLDSTLKGYAERARNGDVQ